MEERFEPLVRLYAQKAGLGEDLQTAAIHLASLLQEVGMDPWEDPGKLQQLAEAIGSLGTPESGRLADELLARAGEKMIGFGESDLGRAIKEIRPLMSLVMAMRLLERMMGGNSSNNPELQQLLSRLESRLENLEKRFEERDRLEPLRQEIQDLRKRLEEAAQPKQPQLPQEVQQVISSLSDALKSLEQKLSVDPFKTVESVLNLVDKLPKGGATQTDIELAKLKADIQRQLENDRKNWELQLEKMREAREQLQALSRLGDLAITHIGSPLAQAFASGYAQAKQGGQVDLSRLSDQDLHKMRERAEQVIQRYAEAKKQIEQELERRKPKPQPVQETPQKPEVKVEPQASDNPVPNPPPSG
jgi:tetratricopeptide (TPR) repeat protein